MELEFLRAQLRNVEDRLKVKLENWILFLVIEG